MKIYITDEGKESFSLKLPSRLLLNGFFASFVPLFINRKIKKYGIRLKGKTCRKFVRAIYKSRKHFGGKLELVNVTSKDGSRIDISI